MVVIACNTASSAGYNSALPLFNNKDLLVGVIQPISEYIASTYQKGSIGVIATRSTVDNKAYSKQIKTLNKNLIVSELATPLLASMIEQGFYSGNIDNRLVNSYLENDALSKIDALVLGCTHYPLIKDKIKEYYNSVNKVVDVIDGSEIVAQKVKKVLQQHNLENSATGAEEYKFYVSENSPSFKQTAKYFFDECMDLEHYPMW